MRCFFLFLDVCPYFFKPMQHKHLNHLFRVYSIMLVICMIKTPSTKILVRLCPIPVYVIPKTGKHLHYASFCVFTTTAHPVCKTDAQKTSNLPKISMLFSPCFILKTHDVHFGQFYLKTIHGVQSK